MPLLRALFLPLPLALLPALAPAQPAARPGADADKLKAVPAAMQKFVDEGELSGAVTVVGRKGGVLALDAVGQRDIGAKAPMTKDTLFRIASMTKPVTAIGIMILADEGKLSPDDDVAKHLPEFTDQQRRLSGTGPSLTKPQRPVKLRDLLTHTSGIMSAIPPVPPDVLMDIRKVTAFACGLPLESQPGERVNYSILLGHSIIAALCLEADGRGRSYAQMLKDEVFGPLGMKDTSLGLRPDLAKRFCPVRVSYDDLPALLPPAAVEGIGALLAMPGGELPGGGCVSTVQDVLRFAEMLRRGGELDGVRLFSPLTVNKFTTPQSPADQPILRGLGWDIDSPFSGNRGDLFPIGSFGHTGFTGTGTLTPLISICPDQAPAARTTAPA